jgi:hypothetical protein
MVPSRKTNSASIGNSHRPRKVTRKGARFPESPFFKDILGVVGEGFFLFFLKIIDWEGK